MIKKMSVWEVDTGSAPLSQILSWGLSQQVDRMLVSVRLTKRGGEKSSAPVGVERRLEKLFGENVLDSLKASAWPGTELTNHRGLIFVIRFNEAVKDIALRAEPELKKWLNTANPPLPEDICLFKTIESYPRFVSVTHEGLAWVLNDKRPKLSGVNKSNLQPQELFFSGRYFCKE